MKKRAIFSIFLFVFILIFAIRCSKQDRIEGLKIGKYVAQDTEVEDWAWVLLKESHQFEFNRGNATSYRPSGTYSIVDNILTLTVHENEEYIFTIDGDKLIFKSGDFIGDLIKEGVVFKLTDKE